MGVFKEATGSLLVDKPQHLGTFSIKLSKPFRIYNRRDLKLPHIFIFIILIIIIIF